MARTSEVPNGDTMAQQLQGRTDQSNFTDIAKELTDAHAHRPGLYQQDLDKVNQALHSQGILPNVDIVGVNGQDFVAKNKADGSIVNIDATDVARTRDAQNGNVFDMNGRIAGKNPDGSGNVVTKPGDNAWTLSRDILKSQGIDDPNDNQIANYVKELRKANDKDAFKHLMPNQKIDYPPFTNAGDNTVFANDRTDAATAKQIADINANYDGAQAALDRANGTDFNGEGITKDRLQNILDTGANVTDAERKGLNFLIDNFSKFQKEQYAFGLFDQGLKFDPSALDQWKQDSINQASLYFNH